MSQYTQRYLIEVTNLLKTIEEEERDSIAKGAELMAKAIMRDELIHVIGPGGHSNMGAYEMFYRAGGLVPINPILDPGTALHYGAIRSTIIERTPGYGLAVLKAYDIHGGVLIIVNAYGINAMCIDIAQGAKELSIPTIGISSRAFAEKVPPDHPARHPSKKNLFEIVDVHIDCHMPYGDAVVKFEELAQKVGPTSTLVNCFTLNLLVIKTVELLLVKGFRPPIWMSANIPGGDEANREFIAKYKQRVKFL